MGGQPLRGGLLPPGPRAGEAPVFQFNVFYHSDAGLHGARHDLPGQNPITGTATHLQLEFPLTAGPGHHDRRPLTRPGAEDLAQHANALLTHYIN